MMCCEGLQWKLLALGILITGTPPDPNCRAKVWESEIQASWYHDNDEYGQRLEERRRQRQPCQCSPDQRPKDLFVVYSEKILQDFADCDSYDLGTNPLFDDRADEFVIYDDLVKSHLPKQGPDRVFGLQNTQSFDSLLSSPVRPDIQKRPDDTVSNLLKTTPFKTQADLLLFPFLVLEAKSESSSRGFEAILTQTFFPIRTLLQLQDDLRLYVPEGEEAFEPLVWFLASRGDAWRLYCGTVLKGGNGEPTKYETTMLWAGSLLLKDDALQLVLIVDYIMDWARDVYRIAILRQLKSMVTGEPFDQISLAYSTMSSMRRDVSRWIPAPPSTVFNGLETASESHEDNTPSKPLDHQALLDIQIPSTELGSLRSASKSNCRFACLYLTEGLLPSFLQVIAGRRDSKDNTAKASRQIINFVSQFDDTLLMSQGDLDLIESLWTGTVTSSNPDENFEDFYVVMEASWYFNPSWDLTREISCLAITKSAFNTLKTYAKFKVRHKGIDSLPQCERRCTRGVIRQCIECLRSGSPWQNLLSAISCTVITVYPLPTRRRDDFTPPVDVLGFGYVKYSQVRSFVTKFLKKSLWKPKDKTRLLTSEVRYYMSLGYTREEVFKMKTEKPPKHTDTSWKRISEQSIIVLEEDSHICENAKDVL
ncbi:hypothetical protein TSTA_071450 [Talaromyces stipitatus ATCC 10500]|uniref:Uncharacterized protein n=1 Tax=Talaromyces stipitatus (strain ATCC 10500 / CBS 375.48 / QM 6759 / NRRL 1006) TaxID=441959 RepID=B8LUH5_TALSN|nr:uncharacterized protein TSTA_071450 [Talaromyces stipitatus ATCC 10500]EED23748.1 hypothetical protein TSTA_071450 [Talaromyces stipitatus ATCC 10500]